MRVRANSIRLFSVCCLKNYDGYGRQTRRRHSTWLKQKLENPGHFREGGFSIRSLTAQSSSISESERTAD